MSRLLEVQDLSVHFSTGDGSVPAVRHINFSIDQGETLGLVGESGSGKSVTSLALMRLLGSEAQVNGRVLFEGKDLLRLPEDELRKFRGNKISMIFQEPMTSLNPVMTVGMQVAEVLMVHQKLGQSQALKKVETLFEEVGIQDAKRRLQSYPHEMSGGQRQRVMIAMAIACQPRLLIADEPTTALDVTIQKQITDLLKTLQVQYKMSILFITHDLALLSDFAKRTIIMQDGQVVEGGDTESILRSPKHAYTQILVKDRPQMLAAERKQSNATSNNTSQFKENGSDKALIEVRDLKKHFPKELNWWGGVRSWVKAVDGVSFDIHRGKTLGLVGESGSGKSTVGCSLLRLNEPDAGDIFFKDIDFLKVPKTDLRGFRKSLQIIFQDPYSSLNPRMTIGHAIHEPMTVHNIGANRTERWERTAHLLESVGLEPAMMNRYPHEFSGGQRQRICIARALSVEPQFIVCDECVSSLDVSIQTKISISPIYSFLTT